jgi:lysophospholipase L1-like esterase
MQRFAAIQRDMRDSRPELVFLGDSITQGLVGTPIWKKLYMSRGAVNAGITSDGVQHMLWRVQNGNFDGVRPKVVVLLGGINNLVGDKPESVAVGIRAIIHEIQRRSPATRVLLMGIFPTRRDPSDPMREKVRQTNLLLAGLADGRGVVFLDIGNVFLDGRGRLARAIMPDYLHPSREGYLLWAEAMEPILGLML